MPSKHAKGKLNLTLNL